MLPKCSACLLVGGLIATMASGQTAGGSGTLAQSELAGRAPAAQRRAPAGSQPSWASSRSRGEAATLPDRCLAAVAAW